MGKNGGSDFGAWALVGGADNVLGSGTGLTYSKGGGSLDVAGGSAVRASGGNNTSLSRGFTHNWTTSNVLWYSYVIRLDAANANTQDPFIGFSDAPTGENNGAGIRFQGNKGTDGNTGGGDDSWTVAVTVNNVRNTLAGTLAEGSTNLVVGKLTFNAGNDFHETWINPDLPSSAADVTPANAAISGSAAKDYATFNSINSIYLQSGFSSQFGVDEFRLGDSFFDVTPNSVPEPSSLALIGLGGLALVSRRRR